MLSSEATITNFIIFVKNCQRIEAHDLPHLRCACKPLHHRRGYLYMGSDTFTITISCKMQNRCFFCKWTGTEISYLLHCRLLMSKWRPYNKRNTVDKTENISKGIIVSKIYCWFFPYICIICY